MEEVKELEFEVHQDFQVPILLKHVREFISKIGFSEKIINQNIIVISELADNLIKHNAIDGKIICTIIDEGYRKGIQIISKDNGPGIDNITEALQDNFSSKQSLGVGLGAVRRFMDEFDIISKPSLNNSWKLREEIKNGTIIFTRKWVSNERNVMLDKKHFCNFGYFTRSKTGEDYNGDSYFIKRFDNKIISVVIDGLGHGEPAHEATQKALTYLKFNFKKSLKTIITELHNTLKKTRGIVISIALLDKQNKLLEYVGIGDTNTRLYKRDDVERSEELINVNGVVGYRLRSYNVAKHHLSKGDILVMISDGISSKFRFEDYQGLKNNHPGLIAYFILLNCGKVYDDATVIVTKIDY